MELHLTPLRNILLPLLLLALLPAAGPALAESPPAKEKQPAAHAESGLKWLESLPEALAEARKRNTYVLVDLYADWCGWCKQLEKKVFSTPEFAARVKDFVLLRVDTEDGADGARLQALHDASSLPSTLILDAKGVRAGQINGYAPTREFIAYIDQQLAAWNDLLNHYPGVLASEETEVQLELAKELHQRQDGERSAALYEVVAKKLDPQSSTFAWLHYMLADSYRLDRRFDHAEKAIEKARAVLARAEEPAMLGEQLDLLRYYIAQDKSDCRGARSSLELFLEAHPSSQLRPRLQKTLNELRLDSKCT